MAWDRQLSEEIRSHVLSCPDCGTVAAEFAGLDALMDSQLEVSIPADFAEMVMARITDSASVTSEVPPPDEAFSKILSSRWAQIGLVGVGSVVAVSNLVRFVFAVVLPAPM